MPHRLLLVEDELGIRVPLGDSLRIAGYEVQTVEDGESALQVAPNGGFDLILLDVLLPGKDGVAVCKELRDEGVDTPVLMLTVKGGIEDRVKGFAAGADDYITKPFEFVELLARINAVVRRSHGSPSADHSTERVYEFGDLRVDTKQAVVWRSNVRVSLSAKEYELLCYFLENAGEVLTRNHLLQHVWMAGPKGESRTVDVHVTGLRKKIEANPARPRWIRTVRGVGYKLMSE